ncbi:hypothetical protein [Corynebacterium nasicanis]|uniref:Uncharacterized protein n=1 Tax=Corynebacterium nasicanis TaxID=1448267 RepID=A0ABW1QDF8_9CORY
MTRVGGPLIDVATLTSWEQNKVFRDPAWRKLAKGIYIRVADWNGLTSRERATAKIVAEGAVAEASLAAGKSAAVIHGMPLKGWESEHPLEFAIYGATKPKRAGITFRHISLRQTVAWQEVETRFGKVQVTPPAATGLDLARWHDLSTGVRGLDHALAAEDCTQEDIAAALTRARGQHGVSTMRDAAALATPWSESPRESDMKVALWKAGVPAPHQQVALYDRKGNFVARLDFFWPEIGFGAEYDGGGKFAGEFGVPVEVACREDVTRQHRISHLGVINFRVSNATAKDGSAVAGIVEVYHLVAERGVPLDPALWRCEGGKAW